MGQIIIGSPLGNFIKHICEEHPKIKTVVEIGTWDGKGSTDCAIQGLLNSQKQDLCFMSLESNHQMYKYAVDLWNNKLPTWAKLVHGRIVNLEDMDSSELTDTEREWFKGDIEALSSCPNILESLPDSIDLLILDGGEFTTTSEFLKLVDRSVVIVLDDTNIRKCRWIRTHVLSNPDKYQVIFDIPNERNGIMAFFVTRNLENT